MYGFVLLPDCTGLVTSSETIIIFKVRKQRMVNINTGYF